MHFDLCEVQICLPTFLYHIISPPLPWISANSHTKCQVWRIGSKWVVATKLVVLCYDYLWPLSSIEYNYVHLQSEYVWVSDQSSIPMFCLKKLISQPREVQNPPNLTQGTLTQYILRLVICRPHPTPLHYLWKCSNMLHIKNHKTLTEKWLIQKLLTQKWLIQKLL